MSALPHNRLDELEKRKLLVSLLARHQRQILGFIHTMVPRIQDAEDIFQETCEVICEKFDSFSPGTDFLAWACEIARWRVRAARTAFARSKITFSDEVVDQLAQTMANMRQELDLRSDALELCLKKLPDRDRDLVTSRYSLGASIEEAAEQNGRSLDAAYKALARIRRVLYDCVSRRTAGVMQ
jgi:RNA polymerase sigma-70 factor, ECF subfamily